MEREEEGAGGEEEIKKALAHGSAEEMSHADKQSQKMAEIWESSSANFFAVS